VHPHKTTENKSSGAGLVVRHDIVKLLSIPVWCSLVSTLALHARSFTPPEKRLRLTRAIVVRDGMTPSKGFRFEFKLHHCPASSRNSLYRALGSQPEGSRPKLTAQKIRCNDI
jgi:hypothetical protein